MLAVKMLIAHGIREITHCSTMNGNAEKYFGGRFILDVMTQFHLQL
jgi:hypothetical protein